MKYFLDFDRTIFDTYAFKRSLHARPTFLEMLYEGKEAFEELIQPSKEMSRRRLFLRNMGTFASHGRFALENKEIQAFLYPDAQEFLRTHDCTIVTYGVRAFITAKVSNALGEFPDLEVVYTSRKKGRTIRRLIEDYKDKNGKHDEKEADKKGFFVFVDDMPFQLESVHAWCPEVQVIEIRRDGKKGDGRWQVIRTFAEVGKNYE